MVLFRDTPKEERLKYGIKDNLVRFSFGVEDFDDLEADILQGLDTMPAKTKTTSFFPRKRCRVELN